MIIFQLKIQTGNLWALLLRWWGIDKRKRKNWLHGKNNDLWLISEGEMRKRWGWVMLTKREREREEEKDRKATREWIYSQKEYLWRKGFNWSMQQKNQIWVALFWREGRSSTGADFCKAVIFNKLEMQFIMGSIH